jgi:hypothetical protein
VYTSLIVLYMGDDVEGTRYHKYYAVIGSVFLSIIAEYAV